MIVRIGTALSRATSSRRDALDELKLLAIFSGAGLLVSLLVLIFYSVIPDAF